MTNVQRKRSLECIEQWDLDLGFQHSLCSIRSYHVIDPKDCIRIINAGNEYAAHHGGWTTDRHQEAPTTDIPFDLLGGPQKHKFQQWKKNFIHKILSPILFRDYQATFRSFEDFFLVRYSSETQSALRVHRDGTVISLVIQLNEDFEGGGTYINSLEKSLVHNTGDLCIHSGWLFHGALPVTSGERYVLIGFCNIDAHWYSHRKLQYKAPFEPDSQIIRKAVLPDFRKKS